MRNASITLIINKTLLMIMFSIRKRFHTFLKNKLFVNCIVTFLYVLGYENNSHSLFN